MRCIFSRYVSVYLTNSKITFIKLIFLFDFKGEIEVKGDILVYNLSEHVSHFEAIGAASDPNAILRILHPSDYL